MTVKVSKSTLPVSNTAQESGSPVRKCCSCTKTLAARYSRSVQTHMNRSISSIISRMLMNWRNPSDLNITALLKKENPNFINCNKTARINRCGLFFFTDCCHSNKKNKTIALATVYLPFLFYFVFKFNFRFY